METTNPCVLLLKEHEGLSARRCKAEAEIARVSERFQSEPFFQDMPVSIFCAGSLARREIGSKSDLDLFVTADSATELESKLKQYSLFAELIRLNHDLGFPPFSNDGEFLKIYRLEQIKSKTGSRNDDSENLFTVRMLLTLESVPLFGREMYEQHLRKVVEHYYRDEKGKQSFRPLFLVNDLLRYWRTVCLNYEERRHEPDRPWRKKNVNLKFSRMLTVFATILPLVANPEMSVESLLGYCRQPPLERLATCLDEMNNDSLLRDWPKILDIYEEFLTWKEDNNIETTLQDGALKKRVSQNAAEFSRYLFRALTDDSIRPELQRYLVL